MVKQITLIFGEDSKEMALDAIKRGGRVTVRYSKTAEGEAVARIIQLVG